MGMNEADAVSGSEGGTWVPISTLYATAGSMVFQVAVAVSCILLIYYVYCFIRWYLRILQIGHQVDKLPGDKTDWLFGNMRQLPGSGINPATLPYIMDMAKRNGGHCYRMWFGPFKPSVSVFHPDTIKGLLRKTEQKAVKNNGIYGMIRPWIGDGLLVGSGERWFRNRKLLTPAFHFDIIKSYVQVYNEAADVLLNKWGNHLQEHGNEKSIEVFASVSLCTLDVILRCAFSYSENIQENWVNNEYVINVMSMAQMALQRVFKLHWYIDWLYHRTSHGKSFAAKCDHVHRIADEIIQKRKAALEKDPKVSQRKRKDFLDILLLARDDSGKGMTDLEIRNEVDTFLFAGHDTTASAISFCLFNLASHPDIQNKARQEVESLIHDPNADITWDDISQLPYLTMCIKESLRRHPPVPFIGRDLETPLEVNGTTLLPGTVVDIVIWLLHHNELVWGEDHMEYKPERFSIESIKKMDSHAFIPFSAGPRNCIGQSFALHEIKVVLAKVLLRYEIEVDKSHPVEIVPEITLRAKNGIKLHFTARK